MLNSREQIEEIINNEDTVKEEHINVEKPIEEVEQEIKPKAKPRPSRAKPEIKIVKESVEPIVGEAIVVEEPPKKINKLKEIVKCPDCNMDMTVHAVKYIHKRRGFCKAVVKEDPEQTPEPVAQQPKPKSITEDVANDYIKQNPDIVYNFSTK